MVPQEIFGRSYLFVSDFNSSGTQNLWPMARRPVSRHTRYGPWPGDLWAVKPVDTDCQQDFPVL